MNRTQLTDEEAIRLLAVADKYVSRTYIDSQTGWNSEQARNFKATYTVNGVLIEKR